MNNYSTTALLILHLFEKKDEPLSVVELCVLTNAGPYMVKNAMSDLVADGHLAKIPGRPIRYAPFKEAEPASCP